MICNDLDCACAITSTTLSISGSGSAGDPYSIDSNAFTICTSVTHPASPSIGQHIYETDKGRVLAFDGTNWIWQHGNPPRFQIEQQVAQSVPDNTGTTVTLTTEVIDTDEAHTGTNGFVTIPSGWGGDWQFWAQGRWATSGTGYRFVDMLVANNTGAPTQTSIHLSGGFAMINTVNNGFNPSGFWRLRAAATVTVQVIQNSGGALDLNSCSIKGVLLAHIPTLV